MENCCMRRAHGMQQNIYWYLQYLFGCWLSFIFTLLGFDSSPLSTRIAKQYSAGRHLFVNFSNTLDVIAGQGPTLTIYVRVEDARASFEKG